MTTQTAKCHQGHHVNKYTLILVRPKTGESAQVSFAPKFVGDFFSIWANFVQCPSQKFADLGEIRPNWQNFARKWRACMKNGFRFFFDCLKDNEL
jgi:hypothetical protein